MTKHRRGDTIIEVMMAVTIFSLVAVGAMTLMNQGAAMAQRSIEITLVRQQIDAQAELLRYVHDRSVDGDSAQTALWNSIKSSSVESANSLIGTNECAVPTNAMALSVSGAGVISRITNFTSPNTYAKVESGATNSQGLSIQLVRVNDAGGSNAYDAYIQACWYAPGLSQPMTLGTIVRIYEPNV